MKTVKHYNIDHHILEPDLHNQNPAEGVIRKIRKKWYRTMVRRRVPKQLWDYGVVWCSEIMSMTHSLAANLTRYIPLEGVTGKTPDISEYLDLDSIIRFGIRTMQDWGRPCLGGGLVFLTGLDV